MRNSDIGLFEIAASTSIRGRDVADSSPTAATTNAL
jgi:hypothetical protein